MAFNADWVWQTTTTTGTGNLTVSSVSNYGTFNQAFGLSKRFQYLIRDASTLAPLEEGIGYLSASTTLVRDKIIATYSGGAPNYDNPTALNLSAGTYDVMCVPSGRHLAPTMSAVAADTASANRFCGTPVAQWNSVSTFSVAANTLYYFAVYIGHSRATNKVYLDISATGTATNMRLGLYTMTSAALPDKLLFDSGSISTASATTVSASITQTGLAPGWYLAALVADGTVTVRGYVLNLETPMAWAGTTGRFKRTYGQVSFTYGALTDPATAITTYVDVSSVVSNPGVWFGVV